jgi:hypothetical protein
MVLSEDQEHQVLEIASEQGKVCPRCGTPEMVVSDLPIRETALSRRKLIPLVCYEGCGQPVTVTVRQRGNGDLIPA